MAKTITMKSAALADALSAADLLGMNIRPHFDVSSEEWLFQMVLRLARRVQSLERQLEAEKPPKGFDGSR